MWLLEMQAHIEGTEVSRQCDGKDADGVNGSIPKQAAHRSTRARGDRRKLDEREGVKRPCVWKLKLHRALPRLGLGTRILQQTNVGVAATSCEERVDQEASERKARGPCDRGRA